MKNSFDIRGDVTAIHLNHNGKVIETLIDTEDLERVQSFPYWWHIEDKGNALYVCGRTTEENDRKRIWLHRFIMGTPDDLVVDHKDHYTLDNRKQNLRNVTVSENSANTKIDKFTGVHKFRGGYRVRLTINGERKSFGVYENLEEAVNVAKKLRRNNT
jgi:hypothetical protein